MATQAVLREGLLGAVGALAFQAGGDLFHRRLSPAEAYLDVAFAGFMAGIVFAAVARTVGDEALEAVLGGLAAGFVLAALRARLPLPPLPTASAAQPI